MSRERKREGYDEIPGLNLYFISPLRASQGSEMPCATLFPVVGGGLLPPNLGTFLRPYLLLSGL